ncbi:hypothetical protein ACGC1H_005553 [Rhizoctonia solani]
MQWYVKCCPGSSKYVIQVTGYKKYFAVDINQNNPYGAEELDAAILELQHQSQNLYSINLAGTKSCLEHPNVKLGNGHTPVSFTTKDTLQGCFWRFEKLNDDSGSNLDANRFTNPNTGNIRASADALVRQDPSGPPVDDVLFYTDALFNSKRTLFNRVQRRAILDWARRIGATNVPTMESFDEYERSLDSDGPIGESNTS